MTDAAEPSLVGKVLALHEAFEQAGIGHAFGGALALAYWTLEPRATADVDVNVSLSSREALLALEALPNGVVVDRDAMARIIRDDQVRLWWGRTPIDLFFRVTDFHDGLASRSVIRDFASQGLPFVCADDLAVLKALFDRPKDWIDIVAMRDAASLDLEVVAGRISGVVGADDSRLVRLAELDAPS